MSPRQILFERTPFLGWTVFLTCVLASVTCLASHTPLMVSLESAEMGVPGKVSGVSIAPGGQSVVGWRFEVSAPFQVEQIGGHLFGSNQQPIYGAIIALDSITSLPQGLPFNLDEVVASTTFVPPSPSNEILLPLTATLAPGAYALVFGTDFLGVTGEAAVPNFSSEQPDIPPTTIDSFIIYGIPRPNAPQEWRERLGSHMRMIVRGATVGLAADYNNNSTVDAADYTVWLDNLGTNNLLPNDPLGGTIGQAHYDQWKSNFGTVLGSSSTFDSAEVPVPEPSCLVLLASMAILLARCRESR